MSRLSRCDTARFGAVYRVAIRRRVHLTGRRVWAVPMAALREPYAQHRPLPENSDAWRWCISSKHCENHASSIGIGRNTRLAAIIYESEDGSQRASCWDVWCGIR